MGDGLELSRIDQAILRYCDSESAVQISKRLGGVISPERVAAQKEILLASTSWVTDAQREKLVLLKLNGILAKLEEDTLTLDGAKVQLALLKEIGARLDKRQAAVQVDLDQYDLNIARTMVQAYDIALSYLKGALRDEIDSDLWDELARDALAHAGREVAKKAIQE